MGEWFNLSEYAAQLGTAYYRNVIDAEWRRTGWLVVGGVTLGWMLTPFFVETALVHPSDMIRALARLQGLPKPEVFTVQQLASGFIETVIAFVVLMVFQFVGTVLFYRRAQLLNFGPVAVPSLWPLAALLTGVLGSAAWLVGTGQFDPVGSLVGFSSMAVTVAAERIVNGLGRDFVFPAPTGQHPPIPS